MEKIDLDLDDENEITFKVQIEGTRPGEPLCRLMIEGHGLTHSITGDFLPDDQVEIVIPTMKNILREGSYDSYLEVLVDDRVFIPLELKINFENSIKVVAEAVSKNTKKKLSANASLISTKVRNKKKVQTIKEEQKVEKRIKHPAKKRYDENKNVITEDDILDIVKKLKSKVKK